MSGAGTVPYCTVYRFDQRKAVGLSKSVRPNPPNPQPSNPPNPPIPQTPVKREGCQQGTSYKPREGHHVPPRFFFFCFADLHTSPPPISRPPASVPYPLLQLHLHLQLYSSSHFLAPSLLVLLLLLLLLLLLPRFTSSGYSS
jgi:hypothetical protein